MYNDPEIKQMERQMFDAVDRMRYADLNEQICLNRHDSNTAAFWTQESKKAWDESEVLRIKLTKILKDTSLW